MEREVIEAKYVQLSDDVHDNRGRTYFQDRTKCPKSKHEYKAEMVIPTVLCLNQFSICISGILFCPGNVKLIFLPGKSTIILLQLYFLRFSHPPSSSTLFSIFYPNFSHLQLSLFSINLPAWEDIMVKKKGRGKMG